MKGKKGRPKGRETVKVNALLYPEQKAKLDFLSTHLIGSPPVVGLLRDAVDDFLKKNFTAEHELEYAKTAVGEGTVDALNEPLRLVR